MNVFESLFLQNGTAQTDVRKIYFFIKSDLMHHIESVHNESISNSGVINVKFSTNSPDADKLQNQNGNML